MVGRGSTSHGGLDDGRGDHSDPLNESRRLLHPSPYQPARCLRLVLRVVAEGLENAELRIRIEARAHA